MIAQMEKPPSIPHNQKVPGLTIYCTECKHIIVGGKCSVIKGSVKQCPHSDKHIFKVYITEKGSEKRRTKNIRTRNFQQARMEALQFRKEVKEGNLGATIFTERGGKNLIKRTMPNLLLEALAWHLDFLSNENVPVHMRKERTEDHIKEVARVSKELLECLKQNGHSLKDFTVNELNDDVIGELYTFYNQKEFSNTTFNKRISHLTTFWNRFTKEFNFSAPNWFERINRRKTYFNPKTITPEAFKALLEVTTEENGIVDYKHGVKPKRNLYRPWLKDAFELMLHSGRRREEVINLRYGDIIEDNSGKPISIRAEDKKVNRIQHRVNEEEKKFAFIPVTRSLYNLLIRLGYEKYRNSDNYILAPEIKGERSMEMAETLTRGFSHFYKQVNNVEPLTLKALRKTYISSLAAYMGTNARIITQHSDDSVLQRHYINKQVIAEAAKGFEVFPIEGERKDELEQLRSNHESKQKKMEVSK